MAECLGDGLWILDCNIKLPRLYRLFYFCACCLLGLEREKTFMETDEVKSKDALLTSIKKYSLFFFTLKSKAVKESALSLIIVISNLCKKHQ